MGIMSGSNTDISAGKNFTAAAGESISLFANTEGMKLIAGKGKVDIQAQDDELSMLAKNDIEITSSEGTVTITSAKELVLACGEGYIKLSGGNIEIADPQNILFKSANWQKMGSASIDSPPLEFPKGYGGSYILQDRDGELLANIPYKVTTVEGNVYSGISDEQGKTIPIYTDFPAGLKFESQIH